MWIEWRSSRDGGGFVLLLYRERVFFSILDAGIWSDLGVDARLSLSAGQALWGTLDQREGFATDFIPDGAVESGLSIRLV